MRYWTRSLLGIALAAASVATIAWCTWAATRASLCGPDDDRLSCSLGGEAFPFVIMGVLMVVLPLATILFARRTEPRSGGLGPLAIALALLAAGGAALASALGSGAGTDAEVPGFVTGAVLLLIGLLALRGGLRATGAGAAEAAQEAGRRARKEAGKAKARREQEANIRAKAAARAARADPRVAGLADLAARLQQVAEAKDRTEGGGVAERLRQLDDLRAAGLIAADEHARRRREILESI